MNPTAKYGLSFFGGGRIGRDDEIRRDEVYPCRRIFADDARQRRGFFRRIRRDFSLGFFRFVAGHPLAVADRNRERAEHFLFADRAFEGDRVRRDGALYVVLFVRICHFHRMGMRAIRRKAERFPRHRRHCGCRVACACRQKGTGKTFSVQMADFCRLRDDFFRLYRYNAEIVCHGLCGDFPQCVFMCGFCCKFCHQRNFVRNFFLCKKSADGSRGRRGEKANMHRAEIGDLHDCIGADFGDRQ